MIITKTPFRMSFFGGGTDMESFFREYGGAVLSTTFDKYCYVNVRHLPPFFSYATELSYAKTERVNSLEEIEHPAIRNAMKMLDMHHIRLTYEADLPARSGLGTSSSFAVGMLNAFYALKGQYASKEKLAKEAIYLERVLCAAVSTDCIDALYARGIAAGALGGKLLGAGGGGFLVFYVEPEHQAAVRQAMQELLYIPFRFENGGTRVIYYAPEEEPAL